jgi:hypothetical protein
MRNHADPEPDPGRTLQSQKVERKMILKVGNRSRNMVYLTNLVYFHAPESRPGPAFPIRIRIPDSQNNAYPCGSWIHNTGENQCRGSWIVIPDPNFLHPGSRIRIKEFKYYFDPKNCFYAFGNMIQVLHPGSGSWIWIQIFYSSWIPGSKRHRIPDPQHWYTGETGTDLLVPRQAPHTRTCALSVGSTPSPTSLRPLNPQKNDQSINQPKYL